MNEIKDRWDEIKEIIRLEYELTDILFDTWVAPLNFYKVEGNVVTIMVPADKANLIKYIQNKYMLYFQVTISQLMNANYEIAFILVIFTSK